MGAAGLFLVGIGDSSFLFLPLSNDILLIAIVSSGSGTWRWVISPIAAAIGSTVGVLLLDLILRNAGEERLERFIGSDKLERLRKKTEKHGVWAVFLATLMPPPFPFTPVIAAASALQSPRREMLIAVFLGRLIRYTAESLLALRFGRQVLRLLRSNPFEYFAYGFIVMALIGSILTIRKWRRTRDRPA
jgi:membrane protein YqaA with SNARE-associated domain